MKILYHHRTRATDAQGIHIQEIVHAFQDLGHQVDIVSPAARPQNNSGPEDSKSAAPHGPKQAPKHDTKQRQLLPLVSEAVQLGYNVAALPLLLMRLRGGVDFVYERYALFNFAGVLAARLMRKPIILEVNSPLAVELNRDGAIKLRRFAQWAETTICNLATRVLVVSTPLARIMESKGVRPSKLAVVPNGVNLREFKNTAGAQTVRGTFGIAPDQVVIGFSGWFKKWHGIDKLIEAFHHKRLYEKGAVLLLVGDGPAMPELRQYVSEQRLEKHVLFTGPVPHSRMPEHVAAFDIAVQPAANEYCCPMKLLEYMALSKAIVAPRQDNIADILKPGEALFFEPGNTAELASALEALVLDPDLRRKSGERGRHAIDIRGYLWSRNAERAVQLAAGLPAQSAAVTA